MDKKNLPNYDVYLTASREEAGANHVLEAMAAGLPVVYHDEGGSIPEYCKEYSNFNFSMVDELPEIFDNIYKNYEEVKSTALGFNRTISDAISQYVEIIEKMK